MQVDQKGRRATVTLDAIDPSGKYLNEAETELTVIDPQFGNRKLVPKRLVVGHGDGGFRRRFTAALTV